MKSYGIALGIIALAHLLGLFGFSDWRWLAIFPVSLLVAFAWDTFFVEKIQIHVLWGMDDAPYASWSAATLVVWSTALAQSFSLIVWFVGASLAVLFFVAGVPHTWARRARIDLAHVSWYTPAVVAGLDAPHVLLPAIRQCLGWGGFLGMAVVMLFSAVRMVRGHDPLEMRSPWYGLGGSAVMSLWGFAALPDRIAFAVFLALCAVCVFWVFSVAHHRGWGTQGAWSNLFSLCSMSVAALHVHIRSAALLLGGAAVVSFAWDAARTVVAQWRPIDSETMRNELVHADP